MAITTDDQLGARIARECQEFVVLWVGAIGNDGRDIYKFADPGEEHEKFGASFAGKIAVELASLDDRGQFPPGLPGMNQLVAARNPQECTTAHRVREDCSTDQRVCVEDDAW